MIETLKRVGTGTGRGCHM